MATTNNTTVVRVTKVMKLSAIIEMLENGIDSKTFTADNHIPTTFYREDAVQFLNAEIAALNKKNSGERKETQTQKDNAIFKKMIIAFLNKEEAAFMPSDAEKIFSGRTCTEILKGIPEFENHPTIVFNNQKIAALVNQLAKEDKLIKETIKGRSYFKTMPAIDEEAEEEGEEA